jgi:hypothetical protein
MANDGGVIKEIIKAGSGFETPEKGDKVNGKFMNITKQFSKSTKSINN